MEAAIDWLTKIEPDLEALWSMKIQPTLLRILPLIEASISANDVERERESARLAKKLLKLMALARSSIVDWITDFEDEVDPLTESYNDWLDELSNDVFKETFADWLAPFEAEKIDWLSYAES